jgi:hypothetical protein
LIWSGGARGGAEGRLDRCVASCCGVICSAWGTAHVYMGSLQATECCSHVLSSMHHLVYDATACESDSLKLCAFESTAASK